MAIKCITCGEIKEECWFGIDKHNKDLHRHECNECDARRQRKQRAELRIEIIKHYGGKCACCGEDRMEFLAIDHINGGGNKHRKAIGVRSGSAIFRWLKLNSWPVGFRVLCHNCNVSRGCYGYCPHERYPNA